MQKKQYRAVFIITPVLSEEQTKGTVEKFKEVLIKAGAEITYEDAWGLKKLAYPIQNKNTGYYQVLEFTGATTVVAQLETEYRRDEKILRYLTTSLDKDSADYYERKRKGLVGRKKEEKSETKTTEEA
jgi:small subunit ribosomal protein S6